MKLRSKIIIFGLFLILINKIEESEGLAVSSSLPLPYSSSDDILQTFVFIFSFYLFFLLFVLSSFYYFVILFVKLLQVNNLNEKSIYKNVSLGKLTNKFIK